MAGNVRQSLKKPLTWTTQRALQGYPQSDGVQRMEGPSQWGIRLACFLASLPGEVAAHLFLP